MERKLVRKEEIQNALREVGVKKGQTLMVHTSLSRLGFVCGGAQVIWRVLLPHGESMWNI